MSKMYKVGKLIKTHYFLIISFEKWILFFIDECKL